jgi:DNA-binding GntR family transcriptional regulator
MSGEPFVASINMVRDRTLRDHAYRTVRSAILDGRLPAGSRIIEAKVSEALGISRGPLREAIRQLESEGLLVTRSHRDTRVVQLTGTAIIDLYAVRAALEGYAAVSGLETLRAFHLDAMQLELEELDRAGQAQEWELVAILDAKWHAHIPAAAGNAHLLTVWTAANDPLRALFTRVAPAVYKPDQVRERHGALLETLRTSNGAEIEQAIRAHYFQSAHAFAAIIDANGAEPSAGEAGLSGGASPTLVLGARARANSI